jgi:adenine deaminase
LSGIVVVGTNDKDMAGAVNRIFELQGGNVVYSEGEVLAELPLPVVGMSADLPIEVLHQRYQEVQQKTAELGTWVPDVQLTFTALTADSIPFLRICEEGLVDIRKEELVDLIVS